jgi:hypothetical protein
MSEIFILHPVCRCFKHVAYLALTADFELAYIFEEKIFFCDKRGRCNVAAKSCFEKKSGITLKPAKFMLRQAMMLINKQSSLKRHFVSENRGTDVALYIFIRRTLLKMNQSRIVHEAQKGNHYEKDNRNVHVNGDGGNGSRSGFLSGF